MSREWYLKEWYLSTGREDYSQCPGSVGLQLTLERGRRVLHP